MNVKPTVIEGTFEPQKIANPDWVSLGMMIEGEFAFYGLQFMSRHKDLTRRRPTGIGQYSGRRVRVTIEVLDNESLSKSVPARPERPVKRKFRNPSHYEAKK